MLLLLSCVINSSFAAISAPQPALDACSDLSEGTGCEFVTPEGTQTGFCSALGSELVCDPNGSSDSETLPEEPTDTVSSDVPQPALDACSGLSEGTGCEFVTPEGTQTGFCSALGSELVCDPNGSSKTDSTPTVPGEIGTVIGTTGGTLPDTGQTYCYDASNAVTCPDSGEAFYGQDAQYQGNTMSYTNNGDGTISDNVTGLMWQQSPDTNKDGAINADDKLSFTNAQTYCEALTFGNYTDWRLPDIKQLYSLINFDGEDVSSYQGTDTAGLIPYIDTRYFDFGYGDTNAGERLIDAQYASATQYVSTTMNGEDTMFGVNFADGRIKGYPITMGSSEKTFYVCCTRGDSSYGQSDYIDNSDGTITDTATSLMWEQDDNAEGLIWEDALALVERQNAANHLGYSDWRLPNAKELQSLLDYSRSPDTTSSAAIDPLFNSTAIVNEGGQSDYPYYWSSTTHISNGSVPGETAVYLSFGRAMGNMEGNWLDVHGAGAQRSEVKTGDPADYPTGHGPQGDAIRIYNYVRLVRTAVISDTTSDTDSDPTPDTDTDSDPTLDTNTDSDPTLDTDTDSDPTLNIDTDTSQCAVYDYPTSQDIRLPCIDIGGTLYSVDMEKKDGLRYQLNMNTLLPIDTTPNGDCATFPYGPYNRMRLNCLELGDTKLWVELDFVVDSTDIEFDVVDFGNL